MAKKNVSRRPKVTAVPKNIHDWLSQNGRLGGLATKKLRQAQGRKSA
jgi:hypothetical protein